MVGPHVQGSGRREHRRNGTSSIRSSNYAIRTLDPSIVHCSQCDDAGSMQSSGQPPSAALIRVLGVPEGRAIIRMWFVGEKCCTQAGNRPPRRQIVPILCSWVLTARIELQSNALAFSLNAGYVISGNYPCIIMIIIITMLVCRLYTQSKAGRTHREWAVKSETMPTLGHPGHYCYNILLRRFNLNLSILFILKYLSWICL